MGTIIDFPAGAVVSRRPAPAVDDVPGEGSGIILILPVIRVERTADESSDGRGPKEGAAPGRRRRRRS